MGKGILLNQSNDLDVVNGSLVIGERTIQDAFLVLSMNQGELKEDPLAGVNLIRMIRSKVRTEKMRRAIEIGLERAGIRLFDVKDQIQAMVNGEKI